jgi:hypothetical protein
MATGGRGILGRGLPPTLAGALAVALLAWTGVTVALWDSPASVAPGSSSAPLSYCRYSLPPEVSDAARVVPSPETTDTPGLVQPEQAPPVVLALEDAANWTGPGISCYRYTVTYAMANLTVGRVAFELKTDLCQSVPGVLGIELVAASGSVVASENLVQHTWNTNNGTPVTAGDRLLIGASSSLSGDQLVYRADAGGWGEGGSIPIGAEGSEVEGCNF